MFGTLGSGGMGFGRLGAGRGGSAGGGAAIVTTIGADGYSAVPVTVPAEFDPDTPGNRVSFPVSRQGYDTSFAAATFSEDVVLTKRLRNVPYSDGTIATATSMATVDPSGKTAISRWLFAACDSGNFTNNSAFAAPKPVAACLTPDRQTVRGSTLRLDWVAFTHGARGRRTAPAIRYRINAGSWQLATWADELSGTVARYSVPGFTANVDISGVADGTFTIDWEVAPAIGTFAAIRSTLDAGQPRNVQQLVFVKATAAAVEYFVASTGNDTTGDGSSALPWLTIGKALNVLGAAGRDGAIINVKDSMAWGAVAVTLAGAANTFVTIRKDPMTGGSVTLSLHTALVETRCKYLKFEGPNLNITRTAAVLTRNTANGYMWFDRTVFDNGSFASALTTNYTDHIFTGGSITNYSALLLQGATAVAVKLMFGLQVLATAGAGLAMDMFTTIGCDLRGVRALNSGNTGSYNGYIIAFNRMVGCGSSNDVLNIANFSGADLDSFAIVSNEIEWSSATAGPGVSISRDRPIAWGSTNAIIWNNTVAATFSAGRCNLFYDDNNLSAGGTQVVRSHTVQDVRGNVFSQVNVKAGQFCGATEGDVANARFHIGNWGVVFGCGWSDNVILYLDASSDKADGNYQSDFSQMYAGLNASIGAVSLTRSDVWTAPGCVTWNGSIYTAGAANGTYTVKDTAAPQYQRVKTAVLPRTLGGNARNATNDHAGARDLAN